MFTKNNISISVVVIAVLFLGAVATSFVIDSRYVEAAGSCGSCGTGGGTPSEPGGGPQDDGDGYTAPKPLYCDISVANKTITLGQTTTLSWTIHNGLSAQLQVGSAKAQKVGLTGTMTVKPTETTSYRVVGHGKYNQVACTATVKVNKPVPPPPAPAPTCVMAASPASITAGGNSKLTWTTKNAVSASINQGVGNVAIGTGKTLTVSPAKTITYTMTVKNKDGKQATCAASITVKAPPTPVVLPVCTLTFNTGAIYVGETAKLSITSKNAQTAKLSSGESIALSGVVKTVTGTKPGTLTYVATVKNKDGSANCSASLNVKAVPAPTVPSCVISASPTSVVKGGSTTLTWTTKNATVASIDQGVGTVAVGTNKTISNKPAKSQTYTMTVKNAAGKQATCATVVKVTESPVSPACTLTSDRTSVPAGGGDVTFTWTTTNANDVSFNRGVGVVGEDGSKTVRVNSSGTYVLTAKGPGGTVQCSKPITVETEEEPDLTCSDVNFTVSDDEVDRGDDVTLSWSWNNRVNNASIDQGIGSVSNNGSRVVEINDDTTFNITIKNSDSEASCPVSVDIESSGGGGGSSSPRCDLEISDKRISAGDEIELTWDTSRATRVVIEDNHGKELLDTNEYSSSRRDDYFDGDMELTPTKDTTYTLTASRGSRDRTCRVSVDVSGDTITVTEIRDQGTVAGIALTQVPYTGFEAGPALTMLFYTLLALWAAFVAYLFVVRRDRIAGVSLPGAYAAVPYMDASVEPVAATTTLSPAAAYVAATAAAPANLPVAAPVVGYQNYVAEQTEEETELTELENRAHAQKALLSSDAMRYLAHTEASLENRVEKLDAVIRVAKVTFPTEDGWIVLNLGRMEALLGDLTKSEEASMVADQAPTAAGSLAEAIVVGNVMAAYAMIEHRPMVALADAAADLDAVYRVKKGEPVAVSDYLVAATATVSAERIAAAIAALTSAIDGTYQNEAEAVKMAIMKAVKAIS